MTRKIDIEAELSSHAQGISFEATGRYKGLPASTLRSWRHRHCMLCTPLVRAEGAAGYVAALAEWLRGAASVIELSYLPADGVRRALPRLLLDRIGIAGVDGGRIEAEVHHDLGALGRETVELGNRRQLHRSLPAARTGLMTVLPIGFLAWYPCRALLGLERYWSSLVKYDPTFG